MNNDVLLLITLTNGEELFKVALKTTDDKISEDCKKYCLEPENKKKIEDLLPIHVKNGFNIVAVEEIFEIIVS